MADGYSEFSSYKNPIYHGSGIEPAPVFSPMVEPPPPDTKIALMLEQKLTNSMATGKPKKYPTTDTADPEKSGPDYPDPIHQDTTKSEVDVESIMTDTGKANAADAIAAAVNSVITSKAVALAAEYTSKMLALPVAIPVKIALYTSERVGKTTSDTDRNGEPYNPVKLSLEDAMRSMINPTEELNESSKEEKNEEKKNKKADESKKKAQKFIESAQKIAEKSTKTVGEITSHILEGAEWIQHNVDKEIARAEKNIKQELETGYKKIEKDIDDFCQDEGDKIGANIVRIYNNELQNQAKKIKDQKNKVEKKAKIKANSAIQKAKLQIFALVGFNK